MKKLFPNDWKSNMKLIISNTQNINNIKFSHSQKIYINNKIKFKISFYEGNLYFKLKLNNWTNLLIINYILIHYQIEHIFLFTLFKNNQLPTNSKGLFIITKTINTLVDLRVFNYKLGQYPGEKDYYYSDPYFNKKMMKQKNCYFITLGSINTKKIHSSIYNWIKISYLNKIQYLDSISAKIYFFADKHNIKINSIKYKQNDQEAKEKIKMVFRLWI